MSFAATVNKIAGFPLGTTQHGAVVSIAITDYTTGGAAITVPGMERVKVLVGNWPGVVMQWDEPSQKALAYYDKASASAAPLSEVTANDDFAAATFLAIGN